MPGIVLFVILLVVGLLTYQDHGVAWDELGQRYTGYLNYTHAFEGKEDIFNGASDLHGGAFEMPLMALELRWPIKDSRDVYLARHLICHIFFLLAVFAAYVHFCKTFKSQFVACLGLVMLALSPRIYAHSFFNSKDVPFLAMTMVIMLLFHRAFRRSRPLAFAALGAVCGFTTGIRIMGVMFAGIIVGFLLWDVVVAVWKRDKPRKPLINTAVFLFTFCGALCLFWPYLWRTPVKNFAECYAAMVRYGWQGGILFRGVVMHGNELPWNYFPVWFGVTTPIVWLVAGIAGIALALVGFAKAPVACMNNMPGRELLFSLLCFFAPVLAVIFLHSVIYDDWRHLYFVYAPFVLLALYAVDAALKTRRAMLVRGACIAQMAVILFLMVRHHPFHQVYVNALMPQGDEYIRKNYEQEYWACGFKQGLEYITARQPWGELRVCANTSGKFPLQNNIDMLQASDRERVKQVPLEEADYFITNFRLDKEEKQYTNPVYSVRMYGSTILAVYKLR